MPSKDKLEDLVAFQEAVATISGTIQPYQVGLGLSLFGISLFRPTCCLEQ